MLNNFIALLFAHALADFVFQTKSMVENKARFPTLLLHIGIVGALSFIALGFNGFWAAVVLMVLHMATDFIKTKWMTGITGFLIDQAAHIFVILTIGSLLPDLYNLGIWNAPPDWLKNTIPEGWLEFLPQAMLLLAGFIIATRAGGFAVGLFMKPLMDDADTGIPQAGAIIGNLERALAFLFILSGQPQNLGFLIAAKSILRFGAAQNDRKISEYVIIGTLSSFGWVISVALITATLWEKIN